MSRGRAIARERAPLCHPTRLYQVLHAAHKSPQWLAGHLRIPASLPQSWCWNLDLPPAPMRQRVEALLAAHGLANDHLWSLLDVSTLKPAHLHLVADQDTDASTSLTEPPMEFVPREYLTQPELERFGLSADPFDGPENPEDIFLSTPIRAAEAILWDAVKRRQIVIFTGEPGAGKSTLIRRAYGSARRQKQVRFLSAASLNRKKVTHASLATAILRDLTGRETSSMGQEQRDELLRTTLADQRGVFPCLLLDEAHHLSNDALLAIKHVWDSHTLFRQLGVVLVGHPILGQRMTADPVIREFTMRARVVELLPFDAATTGAYLDWRFARAGGSAKASEIFSASALELLAKRGRYPLLINNLAIRALRAAAPTGRTVEAEHLGRI